MSLRQERGKTLRRPKAFASPETGLMSMDSFAVGELGYVLMRRWQSRAVGRPRQRGLGTLTEADLDAGGTVGINVSAIQRIDLRGR
jgi:hypothetical protein